MILFQLFSINSYWFKYLFQISIQVTNLSEKSIHSGTFVTTDVIPFYWWPWRIQQADLACHQLSHAFLSIIHDWVPPFLCNNVYIYFLLKHLWLYFHSKKSQNVISWHQLRVKTDEQWRLKYHFWTLIFQFGFYYRCLKVMLRFFIAIICFQQNLLNSF